MLDSEPSYVYRRYLEVREWDRSLKKNKKKWKVRRNVKNGQSEYTVLLSV
jgi:hypothetical protein